MNPQSNAFIQSLLDKMASNDKDSRLTATNELLIEIQKDGIKLDEDSERRITRILSRLLEVEENNEIQILAIRCLGLLINRTKNDRIQITAILKSCLHVLESDKLQLALGVTSITEHLVNRWFAKFEIYDWDLIINICDSLANKLTAPSSALASFTGHPQSNLNSSIGGYQLTHATISNNSTTSRSSIVSTSSNQNIIQSSNNVSQYAMNLSAVAANNISDLMYHHNSHSQSVSPSSDNFPTKNNESLEMIQASLQSLTARLHNETNHGNIYGCDDHLYDLIEKYCHLFDESIIIGLLEYRTKKVNTLDDKYMANLSRLVAKCFKYETRKTIRLKSIAALSQIFSTHRAIYEDELMDKIFIPNFLNADQENDLSIRKSIVYLLLDFASMCLNHRHCLEALKIIKKILVKPFKIAQIGDQSSDLVYIFDNADVIDSRVAIRGLTKIFKTKLYCLPIDPAIQILDILLDYLYQTYKYPLQAPQPAEIPLIRQELFSLLLKLRANEHGQLGLDTSEDQPIQSISEHSRQVAMVSTRQSISEQNKEKYSPFLICKRFDPPLGNMGSSSKPGSPTMVSNQFCSVLSSSNCNNALEPAAVDMTRMFTAIVDCINLETDYDVLKPVLEGLPYLLANRSLVLSAGPNIVDNLCKGLSELIRNNADKFNKQYPKNNMRSLIYIAMTALIYYKRELDKKHHKTLLATFEEGLRLSQTQCISIITMCLIEMHESVNMMRFLPQILMKLSKFSATVNLATCQLDFLSYLILFPRLCENFAGDEYICIFAIALPFTNPFKFNEYVISMAHRVIAMWFLKCRPTFRKDFVEYIKRNLQSHVIQPFKEKAQPATPYPPVFAQHNTPPHSVSATTSPYDPSRKRSLSLNTENSSLRSRFEYRQSSIGSALMAHSSQVPSSPPPNSPSSPSAFSFNNSDPNAIGFQYQTNQASSKQLNEELIETCTDLISRYTHGQCSAIPHKNPCADYLVDRENSQTWLQGNSLITISTSRCIAPASHGGLCDKCFKLCLDVHENPCRGSHAQHTKYNGEYSSISPASPKSPTFPNHNNEAKSNSNKHTPLQLSSSSSLLTPRSSTGSAFNSISSDSETEYGSPTSDSKPSSGGTSSVHQPDSRHHSTSSELKHHHSLRSHREPPLSGQRSMKNKHSAKAAFEYHHSNENSTAPPQSSGTTCNCWCQGWAEILIRRPTGNTCWLTRLQNTLGHMPPQMVNNGHIYNNNLTSIFNTMSLNEVDESSYLSESDTVISQDNLNLGPSSSVTQLAETNKLGIKNQKRRNQRRQSNPDSDGPPMGTTTTTNSTTTIDSGANSNFASQTSLTIMTSNNVSSSACKQPTLANSSSPILQDSDIGSSVASSSIATPTSIGTANGNNIRDRSSTISVMSPAQQHSLASQRMKNGNGNHNENLAASTTIVGGTVGNNQAQSQHIPLSDLIAPQIPAPKSHGLHPSFVQLQFFNDCGGYSGMLDETATLPLNATTSNMIGNNVNTNQNQNMPLAPTKNPTPGQSKSMILLPKDSKTEVALKVFDRIQPYETHKIGVVYVGNGQVKNRTEILANKHGSRRYVEFLRDLGTLINLSDIDTQTHFIGGLDVLGSDGQFTYFWQDTITQVVFHAATLMPMRPNDLQCNEKIRHIGNDHVCIVYNDSGEPFELITIKGEGQCIIACIEITPVEMDTNLVTVKALPDLAQIIPNIEPKIVTNEGLSLYTRQTAIHLNLASMIYERRQRSSDETILNKNKEPYVSNWVERLRKIKTIRRRVEDSGRESNSGNSGIIKR